MTGKAAAPAPCRLGLTGGIGSGKSTVAAMLAGLGAAVVDADAIVRGVTGPGGAAMAAIGAVFGPEFITLEGALERKRMSARVYADPAARQRLEAIVHPLVGQEMARQAATAERAGQRVIVFDIPLLVESGHWRQRLDRVLVLDCAPATQIARVQARGGLAPEAVQRIIDAQAPRGLRLAAADAVICNENLSLSALRVEVTRLARCFGL